MIARWLATALLIAALVPGAAHGLDFGHPGDGPWRGHIVDRETGQPLEGVVVVAVWTKRYGSVGGLAGGGYFASEEVVTGADGRFTIASLKKVLLEPFALLKGPQFYIFKGGYGDWKFSGQEEWPKLDAFEMRKQLDKAFRRLNSEKGMVIELPPLKTKEERVRSIGHQEPGIDVPDSDVPKLMDAIDRERVSLGLQPLRPSFGDQK